MMMGQQVHDLYTPHMDALVEAVNETLTLVCSSSTLPSVEPRAPRPTLFTLPNPGVVRLGGARRLRPLPQHVQLSIFNAPHTP